MGISSILANWFVGTQARLCRPLISTTCRAPHLLDHSAVNPNIVTPDPPLEKIKSVCTYISSPVHHEALGSRLHRCGRRAGFRAVLNRA